MDDASAARPALVANERGEISLSVNTPLGMVINHADNNLGMVVTRLAHRYPCHAVQHRAML